MSGPDPLAATQKAVAVTRRPGRPGIGREAAVAGAMIAPFLLLVTVAIVAPASLLLFQSVHGPNGFTLDNLASLAGPTTRLAAWNSVVLSLISASAALAVGTSLALVANRPNSRLGAALASFSAVAAHFGGVPLAFAFVSTLGLFGLLTRGLRAIGADIYALGFSLYSLPGLALVYAYFLIPLAILVITPAIGAMRSEWLLAAASLGASDGQRLRWVVLPILAPALVSCFTLLFGSAFSGYATAYALTSGNIVLLPTEIGNVLSGDVSNAPGTGAALCAAMILVMAVLLLAGKAVRRGLRGGGR